MTGAIERAVRAAEKLFDMEGLAGAADIPEPEGADATHAAVAKLGELFARLPGQMRYGLERQRENGGDLSTDRLQGLSEIVQNADDLGASQVRILVRDTELLVAHDGSPVQLPDVMALAMPWLTSKAEDPDSTGRFGIGLMTLRRLSPVLEVYCCDYRVRIGDPHVAVPEPYPIPKAVADDGWTVLRMPFAEPGLIASEDVDEWLDDWGDGALLFLDRVRTVIHTDEDCSARRELALQWGEAQHHEAAVGGVATTVTTRTARATDGESWSVSHAVIQSPEGVSRTRKAVGDETTLAVALPQHGVEAALHAAPGRLHVGLPVMELGVPVCVSAQFDPNPSRQQLNDTDWNVALCPLVADLWAAAVIRQFRQDPAEAWQSVPLPGDVQQTKSPVSALEKLLLDRARAKVSHELRLLMPGEGRSLGLSHLAVADAALIGVLTEAEIAGVVEREAILPELARDAGGRWRDVLEDWAENGGAAPANVGVQDALKLLNDTSRTPEATVALAATAIGVDEAIPLLWLRWLVDVDGERYSVPGADAPIVFTDQARGLSAALGFSRVLHQAYLVPTAESSRVRDWLGERGVFVTGEDPVPAVRRLAARGARRDNGPLSLDDGQLLALRDGFLRVPAKERMALGRDVGKAILLKARRYGSDGQREDVEVAPADSYLPAGLDGADREGTFELAAGRVRGLSWLRSRYVQVLRGAGTGLGAQAFLRLLGASTTPRLRAHPKAEHRYSGSYPNEGVRVSQTPHPKERSDHLRAKGATFTLHEYDSPVLAAVARDIAREQDALARRRRAAALLRVLRRTWSTLSEHATVRAVKDSYGWVDLGETDAFWLWQLKYTPWLDNRDGVPTAPADLRERTTGTVAVYGDNGAGFLHQDLQEVVGKRGEVLTALGVTGEAGVDDLLKCLRELRQESSRSGLHDHPAARILYQALAERLAENRGRMAGMLAKITRAFNSGTGLVLTTSGWRKPRDCFRGLAVFGCWGTFAPALDDDEAFWKALGVPEPGVDDAVAVIREIAKETKRQELSEADASTVEAVVLQTLQLLARLATARPEEANATRLGRLPLRTSHGWFSKRPVYAVDAALADALGEQVPVWLPGAELEQFRALLGPLRVHEVKPQDITPCSPDKAPVDPEATSLIRAALALLREDLQRNASAIARSLNGSWDELIAVEVRVAPRVECHVHLLDAEPVLVHMGTALDLPTRSLYAVDNRALGRASEMGRTVAALFAQGRREVAHAWAAAYDEAEKGREAVRLSLAEEQAERDRAAADAEIAQRLVSLQEEHTERRAQAGDKGRSSVRPATGRSQGTSGTVPAVSSPATVRRQLVDPERFRLVDDGRITTGTPAVIHPSGEDRAQSGVTLPRPRTEPAVPSSQSVPRSYTTVEQEAVAIQFLAQVLGAEAEPQWLRDLRAQHGLGADAVDRLSRFYELKTMYGPEQDTVTFTPSEFERAASEENFFLVVVSGLEQGAAGAPCVRLIPYPLHQLVVRSSSNVTLSGIRKTQSLVHDFTPRE
ncbi:sacsin N-terminal ATP-binding-like domain-containing protein [Streptomyces sp. NPDC058469]|uniref:sacsin N-terminal ATP-binding-like domain-containing protein n=1 Tax=Streptomyces sp. NPDC058469 TaxID=3346514 RepID=UPI00364FC941